MPTLEALMPISDREKSRRNIDRARMAFQSLNFFWRDDAGPLTIHVITPDNEMDHIRESLSGTLRDLNRIAVSFVNETQISDAFVEIPGKGVAKQMITKLAGFMLVRSCGRI